VLLAARRGEVDIAFVPGPEDWTRLRGEELWRDRLVVALAEDHPLARDNAVRAEDLQRQTFLAPGSSADRQAQRALIARAIGGEPAGFVCVEAERESVFHLVGLGFGVALACGSGLGTIYPGVVYRPIASPWTLLPFHAVWRSSCDNPELGPFLAAAREAAKDWVRPQ
jgi:DNA-binding transcriptional LysR family regulator